MTPSDRSWKPRGRSSEANAALFAIVAIVLTGVVMVAGLLRLADALGPKVGDIISFPPTQALSAGPTAMAVRPADASHGLCTLDMQVVQKSGGSLVIEAKRLKPARSFLVHWSGVRTSNGAGDCGGSVDLVMDQVQVAALIFAAGGTGVKAQD